MTAQKSWRKKFSSTLATATTALLVASGVALAPTAAFAADDITVTEGTAEWGISEYINSAGFGRPNPLPAQYIAPATFDATSRISSWGAASGTIAADGSASLNFEGTSVNFAATGGGWLKLADLQVNLDASGNGVVSADVAYGTAPGSYPNIVFDPAQAPTREARIDIVTLQDNTEAVDIKPDSASWSDLGGVWAEDFIEFVAGDAEAEPAIPEWSYASNITNTGAADRLPSPFSFSLDMTKGTANGTVTKADYASGLSVKVDFTGAVPEGNPNPIKDGAYAAIIKVGTTPTFDVQGVSDFIPNARIVDGAGSVVLTGARDVWDRNASYEVVVWYAHGEVTPATFIARAPLTVTEAQWDALETAPAAKTTTSVKFASATYNKKSKATVTVKAASGTPTGAVTLKVAGKTYKKNLSSGKATFTLNKLAAAKKHNATVSYKSSNTTAFANSSDTTKPKLTVKKATPKVSVKLAKSKVKANKQAKVKVAVTVPGNLKAKASSYKVAVYEGKKKVSKTVKLNKNGKANVTVKKLKAGNHKLKVKVLASKNTKAKTSATKTLKVVK